MIEITRENAAVAMHYALAALHDADTDRQRSAIWMQVVSVLVMAGDVPAASRAYTRAYAYWQADARETGMG